jgi:hypothetical protein
MLIFGVALIATPQLVAQEEEPAPAEEPVQEEVREEAEEDALPGLDELLGLVEDGAERDAEALDTNKAELERELTDEELGEQFIQAIRQMQEAADRIERGRDGGLVTQRLQEEILVKLDVLIEQSQDPQGGQGSQSKPGDSSGEPPPPSSQQPGGEQGEPGSGEDSGGQAGAGDPSYNEGQNELIEAAGAGWGALPQRVRDTLLEGLNDVFSSRYKEQTEAYYRRLAEEGGNE